MRQLRNELSKVPATIPYLAKARTSQNISLAANVAAMGLILISNKYEHSVNREGIPYKIAAIVCASVGIVFTLKFSRNLKKSIRIYNDYYN